MRGRGSAIADVPVANEGAATLVMTVDDLKCELAARKELKSGSKAWLRRRLHAANLRAAAEGSARAARGNFYGSKTHDSRVSSFTRPDTRDRHSSDDDDL